MKKFELVYEYLSTVRRKDIDDELIWQGLNKLVEGDRATISLATTLDQIVFQECQMGAK